MKIDFTTDAVVWLQYCTASSCLTMRVAEQAAEAFMPYHVTHLPSNASLRCAEPVVETLMIAARYESGRGIGGSRDETMAIVARMLSERHAPCTGYRRG